MNNGKLNIAVVEAKRFIDKAKLYAKRYEKEEEEESLICSITGCKESGAVLRSSMDLSRALSELRKC